MGTGGAPQLEPPASPVEVSWTQELSTCPLPGPQPPRIPDSAHSFGPGGLFLGDAATVGSFVAHASPSLCALGDALGFSKHRRGRTPCPPEAVEQGIRTGCSRRRPLADIAVSAGLEVLFPVYEGFYPLGAVPMSPGPQDFPFGGDCPGTTSS